MALVLLLWFVPHLCGYPLRIHAHTPPHLCGYPHVECVQVGLGLAGDCGAGLDGECVDVDEFFEGAVYGVGGAAHPTGEGGAGRPAGVVVVGVALE